VDDNLKELFPNEMTLLHQVKWFAMMKKQAKNVNNHPKRRRWIISICLQFFMHISHFLNLILKCYELICESKKQGFEMSLVQRIHEEASRRKMISGREMTER
jgi:hypothetical protein